MANNEIVEGGDLMLFATIDKVKYTLAFATSHKLSINAETSETTNKDHGGGTWKSSTVKKLSWNVSSDNLFIEKADETKEKQKAFGDLFDLMTSKKEIEVVFAPVANSADNIPTQSTEPLVKEGGWQAKTTGTYAGKVVITSLELNAPSGDNATYSVQLEGVGALTHTAEAAA